MGLEHVELISALEEAFRIELPDRGLIAPRFRTVADVEATVVEALSRGVPAIPMDSSAVRLQVRSVLGCVIDVDPSRLEPHHDLIRDLGMG
jgi:hypothetical protein